MNLLVLTTARDPCDVLPALSLLPHQCTRAAPVLASFRDAAPYEAIVVDARSMPERTVRLCQRARARKMRLAVLAVVTEASVTTDWLQDGIDGLVLSNAGPAEVDARLRLLPTNRGLAHQVSPVALVRGDLVLEAWSYTAFLQGRLLALTRTEFELLHYLARRAGEAVTRAQLLVAVWGDAHSAGNERLVDMHIRRLRGKLGPKHHNLIRTARGLGYKFVGARVAVGMASSS